MKRYIKYISASINTDAIDTSVFNNTPFKPDTTTSYYNDFLNNEDLEYMQTEKNRTGEIVMMTPDEYIQECADNVFNGRVNASELKQQRSLSRTESGSSLLEKYADDMKSGDKFPLCYINYADHNQEGLHRMIAAGEAFGWDKKYPVLVVNVYDEKTEHENEVFRKYLRFRDYDFEDVCKNAAYDVILGWKSLPDENMLKSLKSEIIKQAAIYDEDDDGGYDIDVDIEYEEDGDNHILHVYITRFEDYDSSGRYDGYDILIDDYIRFDDNKVSDTSENLNIDDIDLDISDFFFKD